MINLTQSGSWIEGVPTGFMTLANISASDFYVSGWWPNHEGLANKTVAISGLYQGQPMFIFAGNPVNKTHTINFYRWVSNAIFGTNLTSFIEGQCTIPTDSETQVVRVNHNGQTVAVYQQVANKEVNGTVSQNSLPALADGSHKDDSKLFWVTGLLVASGGLFAALKRREED